MKERFMLFLFYVHIVLIFFIIPLFISFGGVLNDYIIAAPFIIIFVFNLFFFPLILKDISNQHNESKRTYEKYKNAQKEKEEIKEDLNKSNELVKKYEKLLSNKIKYSTMSNNKFPTAEALDLISTTYEKYAHDDLLSFRSHYYKDLKTNFSHLEKYYKDLSILYRMKDLKYNRIENMKQISNIKITSQKYSRDKAVLKDLKGKAYTYDVELLTTQISIPCEYIKGSAKEYTVEIISLLYAYFPNSNETQYLRFVQSEADEGIIVKNTVSYNRHCEVISTHGHKYIVKL